MKLLTCEEKKINFQYALILGAYWMIFAVSQIFIVPILRNKGFDNSQIGILISIRSLSAIVVSPIIAGFSDKHPKVQIKYILLGLVGINIINTLVFKFAQLDYLQMIIVFIILGATTNTMPSLHSSMAVKHTEPGKRVFYSIGRGTGSISYAVIAALLGFMVGDSNLEISIDLQLILDIASIFFIITFPSYKVDEKILDGDNNSKAHSGLYLLTKYPNFTGFLVASAFLFVGYSMCNSFIIDIITSRGGDNISMGISSFILGAAELPTAIFFARMKNKFGIRTLLVISSVAALMKMMGLYFSQNVYHIYLSQLLQMFGNGMFWHVSVNYVNEIISPEDQVKGQSYTNIASTNIGAILGSVISGSLLVYFDIDALIIYGCICSFIGVVIMCVTVFTEKSVFVKSNITGA